MSILLLLKIIIVVKNRKYYSVSKKMGFSGKTLMTTFKLIQNAKMGVFWKIQDICYIISTEIFKIEEEMTEKMKPKVANPPSENGQNSLLPILIH